MAGRRLARDHPADLVALRSSCHHGENGVTRGSDAACPISISSTERS